MNKKFAFLLLVSALVLLGFLSESRRTQAGGVYYQGTWVGYTAPYNVYVSCLTPWEATNTCGGTCTASASFPSGSYQYGNYTCAVSGGPGRANFNHPDDEGHLSVNGSTVCSYYGCGCDCHSTAANNCATDPLFHGCNNVSVSVSSGSTVSVTGRNDCLATGDGGVFGGASGSVVLDDGETCCVAGYRPAGNGVCVPDVPCQINSFTCSSNGTLTWDTSNCSSRSISPTIGLVSAAGSTDQTTGGTGYILTAQPGNKTANAFCPAVPSLDASWNSGSKTYNVTANPGQSISVPFNFRNTGDSGSSMRVDCLRDSVDPNVGPSNAPHPNCGQVLTKP